MYRPLPLFIGLRYTRAKRRNHFISFISIISMLGIALGVTALITVLSVMNGFETELRSRILGMASHATIYGLGSQLNDWHHAQDKADQHPEVLGTAPFIQREGMTTRGKAVSGTLLRGILPGEESRVSDVGEHMLIGSLDSLKPGKWNIVLGTELATYLNARVGDKVTVVTPQAMATPAGVLPRLKRFTVSGIYEIGMYEFDRSMALIHMQDAAKLFRLGDAVTGVRLTLDDVYRARTVAREIAKDLPGLYRVRDWTREHANFFKALATEKTVMFIILLLIVAVAAFNIVSTLVMMVTDKQSDIAILRTLGATPASIMGVFMVQGVIIGAVGTLLGLAGGLALAANVESIVPAIESLFGVQFLPADIYYISELPSEIHSHDVIAIAGLSFISSFLATLYPAWRASRTQPVEALRYE